jgi:Fur family ferric uptake transcriptional regulator
MKKTHRHSHNADDLAGHLRGKSRKMTGPRRALLAILEKEEHPLTIRELHALLPGKTCDLATVYRSIRLLEEMGLVQRFDFGDGVARFELMRHEQDSHHHHLVCRGCSKVVEIEDCFPSELEERIAARNGFSRVTHRLEFFGICADCGG